MAIVCDKCKKNPVTITLKFRTKSFALCERCALKIVSWLEEKPLKEKMNILWDNTNKKFNIGNMGGGI